ncbi:MAG: ATP synthase F1 subunit epsilon [Magnetococcales bacterium]|nr:ATP synthase F1 subunit epsilon [Magnetococcales bacterium]MBF0156026.1 ATP synthase F1 subunit epsilon [Magnetococcales bacterium]
MKMELVTPERRVLAVEPEMVIIPGVDGDFGVLPGHMPLVSTVRAGRLEVRDAAGTRRYVVSRGYAEALPDRVTLLVDRAIPVEELKAEAAKASLSEENGRLAQIPEADPAYDRQKAAVEFAAACVAAVGE